MSSCNVAWTRQEPQGDQRDVDFGVFALALKGAVQHRGAGNENRVACATKG